MSAGHPTTGEQLVHSATITRVDVMQTGARVLMYIGFATGVLLMIVIATSHPGDPLPIWAGALHCINFGATMAVAVGALHGHRAILAAVNRTQRQMARYDAQIEDRLKRLERLDRKIEERLERLEQLDDHILSAAAATATATDLGSRRHRN